MKNLFTFVAVAGMAALVSCGGAEDAAKKLQDSINMADSIARVQWTVDSTHMADSIKMAADAVAAQMKADSARVADSMAKLDPKKKK